LIALDVILSADPTIEPFFAAGGTCGNVLAALSYFGWDAFPVARLNGDAASELVRADLSRWNVSLDFATQTPSAETPIIVQTIRRNRRGHPIHRFSLTCPACGAWFPPYRPVTAKAAEEVIDSVCGASRSAFSPRVFFLDRVSRGALLLAEAFAAQGAVVVFEPIGVGDSTLFKEALACAHVVKYSHQRLPHLAAHRLRTPEPP
jgi:fructokinase